MPYFFKFLRFKRSTRKLLCESIQGHLLLARYFENKFFLPILLEPPLLHVVTRLGLLGPTSKIWHTDKKEKKIFLANSEGSSCKVIYEEGLPNI